jgi:hypothetical protein
MKCQARSGQVRDEHSYQLEAGTVCVWCGDRSPERKAAERLPFGLTYASYEATFGGYKFAVEYSAFNDGLWSASCVRDGSHTFIGSYATRERSEYACERYMATGECVRAE